MTVPPSDNLESLDRAMRLSNLRQELEENSFYYCGDGARERGAAGETTGWRRPNAS